MIRLIYTSVQKPDFTRQDFAKLCAECSSNNSSMGLTGLLLCNGVEFLQCLEGPRESVSKVYKRILLDARHTDIRLLLSQKTQDRLFDNWAMMGLTTQAPPEAAKKSLVYKLLGQRLYRPWKSLGNTAVDLVYEYANVKAELEKAGEGRLLTTVFDVYFP
ncbi:MAG TPA: BLUF domain-containing protein, partial [Limnobacter sp.]|nr:BLUF domain-containing protein [Limnobacter sp.]